MIEGEILNETSLVKPTFTMDVEVKIPDIKTRKYVIKENGVEVRKASDREKDFLATVNAAMDDYNAALEELINR